MVLRTRLVVVAVVALIAAAGLGPASASLTGTAPRPAARIEARLLQDLAAAGPLGTVEALVGGTDVEAAAAALQAVGLPALLRFDKVGFVATKGSATRVRSLLAQPGVTYVQGNRPLRTTMETAPLATRVIDAESTFRAPDGSELDGSGVGVAVVDSGMAGDHPMYQDQTGKTRLLNIKQACVNLLECGSQAGNEPDEYFINATGLDTDVTALGGHGTHVASIAGGREVTTSNGVAVRGVARNASLYGLGAGAGIFTINAAASLNWVLEHHANPCGAFTPAPDVAGGCAPIRVVNNSYGSPGEYDPADFFAVVGERLVLEGVTVVWAAGNGDDPTSTDPRPNDGSVNLANPPGQSPKNGVLMVANYDDKDSGTRDGELNPSSSRGERGRPETYPDLAAPGSNILAACRPYLPICTSAYDDPNYGEIGGTSMAAPHVAGIVALLVQAYPSLTPEQIEDVLEDTAYRFGDPSTYEPDVATAAAPLPGQVRNDTPTSFDKGHGLVDLAAALHRLAGTVDPGYAGPTSPCASASNSFTDPEGDATELAVADTGVAAASYPGLDVLKSSVTPTTDGSAVRFAIGVSDLTEAPAPGATGDNFRFNFSFDSKAFEVDLTRSLGTDGTYSTEFSIFQNGLTEDVDIAAGLVGGFDVVKDEVWAIVPSDAIRKVFPESPLLTYSSRLEAVSVLAQRAEGAPGVGTATPTADTATAGCPLLLPPPPPPPPPATPKKPGKGKGRK